MNSYDFFINEFICFMNSYMNSGLPRFQIKDPKYLFILRINCKFSIASSVCIFSLSYVGQRMTVFCRIHVGTCPGPSSTDDKPEQDVNIYVSHSRLNAYPMQDKPSMIAQHTAPRQRAARCRQAGPRGSAESRRLT